MRRSIPALLTCAAVAALVSPTAVRAGTAAAGCSVAIDYVHGGNIVEAYRRDFAVVEGQAYVDDFSTATREKRFSATVARSAEGTVVAIDYFSDVGVFHAVGLTTTLVIRGGGVSSTSGQQGFYTSSVVTPASVAGNHQTNYTLACSKG